MDEIGLSGFRRFVRPGFVQLSQEAVYSVRMHTIDSELLFSRLQNKIEKRKLSFAVKIAAERFMGPTAERDNLLLCLSNHSILIKI